MREDNTDEVPTRANAEQSVLAPYYAGDCVTLYHGDCHQVMSRLSAESIDAVVTDPPYDLTSGKKGGKGGGFMGQKWDATGVAFDPETWREVLRVLKPGGYLMAFGAPRTYHRLACAIEDAGFEIRDCLMWLHGQGFPKSLDVSKAIDKAAGAKRRVVGSVWTNTGMQHGNFGGGTNEHDYVPVTAPATPEAEEWAGWGSALKPAWEPIVLARKPLCGTVATNVLRHHTGALHIDACRIAGEPVPINKLERWSAFGQEKRPKYEQRIDTSGRWPANVILDEEAAVLLDEQSGITTSGAAGRKASSGFVQGYESGDYDVPYGDTGGASRFFYCAKASRKERGEGNDHMTVKPLKLMQWLVKLVSPPSCTILDPFAGSGSTLLAAMSEGQRAIGIEQDAHYCDITVGRVERAERDARSARDDETQEESCDTNGVMTLQGLLRHRRAASPAVCPGPSGPPLVSPLARWKGQPSAVRPAEAASPRHMSPSRRVRAPPPCRRRGTSSDGSGSRETVLCRSRVEQQGIEGKKPKKEPWLSPLALAGTGLEARRALEKPTGGIGALDRSRAPPPFAGSRLARSVRRPALSSGPPGHVSHVMRARRPTRPGRHSPGGRGTSRETGCRACH